MKIILQNKILFPGVYAEGVEKNVGKARDNNECSPTQRHSECDFVTKRWSPQCGEKNIVGFLKRLFILIEEEETQKAAIKICN
jgi:hypothetical protein